MFTYTSTHHSSQRNETDFCSRRENSRNSRQEVLTNVPEPEALILLMGPSGTGKSSFVNVASGSRFLVGDGLESCTAEVQISEPFILNGRRVRLVDTPGFDDTSKSDFDILHIIASFLTKLSPLKVQGIIYLHRISDTRVGGAARRNMRMFQKLCGPSAFRNVAIVTTRWDEVGPRTGATREDQFRSQSTLFQPVIGGGASLLRFYRTSSSAHDILSQLLRQAPVELLIQTEMVLERKDISNTEAGLELRQEILKLQEMQKEELQEVQKELEEALRDHENELAEELELEVQSLRNRLETLKVEENKLSESCLLQECTTLGPQAAILNPRDARGSSGLTDAVILLMGPSGAGKSTFANIASGSRLRIGEGLESCTEEIQVSEPFVLDGRCVRLVDTPGFDDTSKSDVDILKLISSFLSNLSPLKVQGILYFHRISDVKVGGVARRNLRMFQKLCGAAAFRNVGMVTTRWDEVDARTGVSREEQLRSKSTLFQSVLDGGASLFRDNRTRDSAHNILKHLLRQAPVELLVQTEMVTERKDVQDTQAGLELRQEILKLQKMQQEELQELWEEMEEAMRDNKKESVLELEQEVLALRSNLANLKAEEAKLKNSVSHLADVLPSLLSKNRSDVRSASSTEKRISNTVSRSYSPAVEKDGLSKACNRLTIRSPAEKDGCSSENRMGEAGGVASPTKRHGPYFMRPQLDRGLGGFSLLDTAPVRLSFRHEL